MINISQSNPSISAYARSRSRSIRAVAVPLVDTTHTTAAVSPALWDLLAPRHVSTPCHDEDVDVTQALSPSTSLSASSSTSLCVMIEWPEERRHGKGKAKTKALVTWVTRQKHDNPSSELNLYTHPSIMPPFVNPPLSVIIRPHRPIPLSLAILQPIQITSSTQRDGDVSTVEDINVSSLISESVSSGVASFNDHNAAPSILRQGAVLDILLRSGDVRPFKLLMLEPVQQGILTPSTRLIISTHPYEPVEASTDYPDHHSSESYGGQTHLSLADFDPDAFLSSSLSLSLPNDTPDGTPFLDGVDLTNSVSSSTSGSLTPRPPGSSVPRPPSPPAHPEDVLHNESDEYGAKFTPMQAAGPSFAQGESEDAVCWLGVGGLGRAGIFEGDWVLLKAVSDDKASTGRLVKALAWERLDEPDDDLPDNPILLPPSLFRSVISTSSTQVSLHPTPFGSRSPTLPTARTITLARVATAESVDKRYERAWLKGLKTYFGPSKWSSIDSKDVNNSKLIRSGDIVSVPVYPDKPLGSDNTSEDDTSDSEEEEDTLTSSSRSNNRPTPSAVVYFTVTSLSYDPLVPVEEDFRSSVSSKARAGELGCWVNAGKDGQTKMVLTGLERSRVEDRDGDRTWHDLKPVPWPWASRASQTLSDLLGSCFSRSALAYVVQLSILVKGSRGAGKRSLIKSIADQQGYNVIDIECYDIVGDTPAVTSGTLLARLDKAKACSPSLLVLHHIEALAKKTESTVLGRTPPIVNVLEDLLRGARESSAATEWPVLVVGTTVDADAVPLEVLSCFKQEVELGAPNEIERQIIIEQALKDFDLAPDVELASIARQTAALNAGDITALIRRAYDMAMRRAAQPSDDVEIYTPSIQDVQRAGLTITSADITSALNEARALYSDSIGAPKIPNVTWDDVGSLGSVKQDILDTIQLPLDHPEMFGEGLKKRSGILLYGPPGTGKTLLAKAVATSCSLNFLSVKGPELLNMYIGESEANVRRIFQKARDAAPCVIFMDELDSVAPKRGNQGDSGGVMDRIVSQLLAELDEMSSTNGSGGGVFVMGATNRPDLLDPALLRPGRFDKLLYLSLPTTHEAQLSILKALTRKFNLDPNLDLGEVAERCLFNYTGADLYALCADAMLGAMMRLAESVNSEISRLNEGQVEGAGLDVQGYTVNGDNNGRHQEGSTRSLKGREWKGKLTPQYYLSKLAKPEEVQVKVTLDDFIRALDRLVPSVSVQELTHYEKVQSDFKGMSIRT